MALGEFEQLVLLAVLHLGDRAYGVEIVKTIEEKTGRSVSRSSLYVTFDRLEAKGHLRSDLRVADPARGGKMRRYVRVTSEGTAALRESRETLLGMWRGLEPVLEGRGA
jgi:DNA-binding PadR family transcriptional regulator